MCPVAPVAVEYLLLHSVCVKTQHEIIVRIPWSFEIGNIIKPFGHLHNPLYIVWKNISDSFTMKHFEINLN